MIRNKAVVQWAVYVKFSFCKVGQRKEVGFKVKWICAIQT